ncbi:MAG: hypothetical protein E5W70_03830 [Mesorhizobium sp.]|uniref:hypothetical protein n=1 Tax=Mesorhizobium sp. TaxID=1871066 RepID=UPI0012093661|nr:hypothetical protein [Mesorhizobium sp.]TIT24444.1 MAG: hypothetical protein E5W70_03830 [Mesorhizobium sp.]
MNAAEQTKAEVAHFEFAEKYIRELLETSSSLTDHERTLIAGNIRGFYATAFPFDHRDDSAADLLREAETAIEEYSCRTPVAHVATEMEGLAVRIRSFLSGKNTQVSDAQKYLDALESIDAVAVDFGHFESAARTMQEIARKALKAGETEIVLAKRCNEFNDQVIGLRCQRDDLLAALKAVVRVADRNSDEFDLARAAIAKAEVAS